MQQFVTADRNGEEWLHVNAVINLFTSQSEAGPFDCPI